MIAGDAFDRADAIVADLFACIDGRDWPALASRLHDGVVYLRPGYAPLVGKPAVLAFYESVRIIAAGRHRVERVISDGEHVACWGAFEGVSRDGRALGVRFADVYRLSGALIRERRTYFDSPAV
jgi:hypothetical protein